VAVKKSLFRNNNTLYSKAGIGLSREAREFFEDLYTKCLDSGYSSVEIDSVLIFELVNANAITALERAISNE